MFDRSPVFNNLARGIRPQVSFKVNGKDCNIGYYLVDDIYPLLPPLSPPHESPLASSGSGGQRGSGRRNGNPEPTVILPVCI
jgi:hypothetical protein